MAAFDDIGFCPVDEGGKYFDRTFITDLRCHIHREGELRLAVGIGGVLPRVGAERDRSELGSNGPTRSDREQDHVAVRNGRECHRLGRILTMRDIDRGIGQSVLAEDRCQAGKINGAVLDFCSSANFGGRVEFP